MSMGKEWNDREVEQLLRRAVDRSVPDLWEQVSTAEVRPLLNDDGIVPPPRAKKRRRYWPVAAALLLVFLALGGGAWFWFWPAAYLSIGDGPDITMGVNRLGYVTDVEHYGSEGETLLSGLSLEGLEVETALRAMSGNLGQAGYLSRDEVPLYVTGGGRYGLELLRESKQTLEDCAALWTGDPALSGPSTPQVSPTISPAASPSPSPTQTPALTPAPSAPPAVNPTTLPTQTPSSAQPNQGGSASGGAGQHGQGTYDAEACRTIALQHAGVSASEAVFTKTELEHEHGQRYYELEFYTASAEFEYKVDTATGAVLEAERQDIAAVHYSLEDAKNIALANAGLTAGQVYFEKAEQDEDDGQIYYELEFVAGGREYEYEIDATTGAILKAERD